MDTTRDAPGDDARIAGAGGGLPRRTLGPSQFPGSPDRLPACRIDDVATARASVDDWATSIVDTAWALPEDYVPPDLVPVTRAGIAGGGRIRAIAIADLSALADATARAGRPIAVQSAYRSFDRQAQVFAGWVASNGYDEAVRFSARAGHSEHQLGTAVDLREASGPAPWQVDFGARPTGKWLQAHAWTYGFVRSYPDGAEDRSCYGSEPWHFRYVGTDEAEAVRRSGLTLREWLWQHEGG
jgi:D-alanyl-D-alanine carboxypeptidase